LTAKLFAIVSGCCCLALIPSCNRLDEREVIAEKRTLSQYESAPAVDVPSAKRFYDTNPEPDAERDPNAPPEHPLVWTTPDGWTEKPPGQMRLIDMRFGPDEAGECYVSAMPGPAGGLAANLNRWRTQMGQSPLSEDEIEKLPRQPFLGAEAYSITIDGDFKGVGAETAKTGYRLIGLIHPASEVTLFVKMTGPKDLVEKNTAAFEAFCGSVKFRRHGDQIPTH
jgi:hypothetical protein